MKLGDRIILAGTAWYPSKDFDRRTRMDRGFRGTPADSRDLITL